MTECIGCGTMGVAVTAGVVASLEARTSQLAKKSHGVSASGSSTPVTAQILQASDAALPSRFIATVNREESAQKLARTFRSLGEIGEGIEVLVKNNLLAVSQSDVVLLWYVILTVYTT